MGLLELLLILTALLANLTGLGAGERAALPVSGVEAVRSSEESRVAAVAELLAPSRSGAVPEARQPSVPPRPPIAVQSPPLYGDRPLE